MWNLGPVIRDIYKLRIHDGTITFYMSIYNYGGKQAEIDVDILESSSIVPDFTLPEPLKCGKNAFCDKGVCSCNSGYLPDPNTADACSFNSCDTSLISCQVI